MPTPSPSNYAGRGARLLARILDSLIGAVPSLVLWLMFFLPILSTLQAAQLAQEAGLPLENPPMPAFGALIGLVLWVIIFTAVQWTYLSTRGQTLGKMMLKIKIVRFTDGTNGGFVPNVLLRGILNGILSMVPFYSIVDICFIFRQDRRCIHDLIANTVVVKA